MKSYQQSSSSLDRATAHAREQIMLKLPKSYSKADAITLIVMATLTIATYIFLNGSYRPENIDDPWYLSFADNYVNHHIATDKVFGQDAAGESGVQLFGITHALVYGHTLNAIGWSRANAHLLSTIFIVAALLCWYPIMRHLGFSKLSATTFSILLLLVEPVFGAANQARPDALILFLASLAVYLAMHKMWLAAGIITAISIEIHPIGAIAVCYVLAFIVATALQNNQRHTATLKATVLYFIGGTIGMLYYLALHAQALHLLLSGLHASGTGGGGFDNAIIQYFFYTKYLRHLPELAITVIAAITYIARKRWKDDPFSALLFISSVTFIFIIRRPNFMYVVFVYPAFLLLIMSASAKLLNPRYLCIALMLYIIPQYALVRRINRNHNLPAYLTKIAESVPNDTLPVIGSPNDWYAFREREFHATCYTPCITKLNIPTFYYIEESPATYPPTMQAENEFKTAYNLSTVSTFKYNSKQLTIYTAHKKSL